MMNFRAKPLNRYLNDLSSSRAIPGGGSAAAVVAALAVSLNLMVVKIVFPKMKPARKKKWRTMIKKLEKIKQNIVFIIDEDPAQYAQVMKGYMLPKTHKKRNIRIQRALKKSYKCMYDLCRNICEARRCHYEIARHATGSIANDLKVSEAFMKAAFVAAHATASINIKYIKGEKVRTRLMRELNSVKTVFKKV